MATPATTRARAEPALSPAPYSLRLLERQAPLPRVVAPQRWFARLGLWVDRLLVS